MNKRGFLIREDGVKYACSYTTNGKHVAGELIDDLKSDDFDGHHTPQFELDDGTVQSFTGTMSFDGERKHTGGSMMITKFNGTF